jgi:hypothetical protein
MSYAEYTDPHTGEFLYRSISAWPTTLAANLRIAAGLCHSHRLGRVDRHYETIGKPELRWFPGCGRSCP